MDCLVPCLRIAEFEVRPYVHEWLQLLAFRDTRVVGVTKVSERLALGGSVTRFAVYRLVVGEPTS
eukprot:931921-Pleurochrysis_carterae.AAC.1